MIRPGTLMAGAMSLICIPLIASAAEPAAPAPPISPQPLSIQPAPDTRVVVGRARPGDGAWLGIQLAPVPAAVASQLKLKNTGVMVRNIFKGSPADQAGLERYDVLTRVDAQTVEGGPAVFSKYIADHKPGDKVQISLIRGGEEQSVLLSLATIPQRLANNDLKYEDEPDMSSHHAFGLRGKILRPGPEGWVLDDLGDMPIPYLEKWLKPGDKRTPCEDNDVQESRRVTSAGDVLQVRKEKDGTIEVRRYEDGTPADKIEPKKYANMEELRRADPEAAKLLVPASRPAEELGQARRDFDRTQKELRGYNQQLRRWQDEMRDYQEALREYMKHFNPDGEYRAPAPPQAPRWREWGERFLQPERAPEPGMIDHYMNPEDSEPPFARTPAMPHPPAEAKTALPVPPTPAPEATFQVYPDGTITATVDDAGTRLILSFPNPQAMEHQAPKLYHRYQQSMEHLK